MGRGTTSWTDAGGESIPNALLLYARLATLTEQITFVPMSVVATTHDPIRVAEDRALFSHMYPGRLGVAYARGYQTRWLQTLSQAEKVAALSPDSDKRPSHVRRVPMMIDKAWTQSSFRHDGPSYQVQFPADGVANWPLSRGSSVRTPPGRPAVTADGSDLLPGRSGRGRSGAA